MTRSAAIPRRLVLLLVVLAAALAFPAAAGAMTDTGTTAPSAPSVWTDKTDYNPGATVTLSGAGWEAGEAVHVSVNDGDGQTWSFADDVTASDAGEFTDEFTLPTWFVAEYSVTVTGSSGATAATSFTDGNLIFAQATVDTTQPTAAWSVSWLRYTDTSCTATRQNGAGTATYTGSTRTAGTEPGIGTGQSAQPTGVTAPTGYTFTYWSSSPDSTTPLAGPALCRQGPSSATLYAHFRPTIVSTSTAVSTSGSPSTYGDQVTLTATVTPANGPAATGTVAFTDGAATLCAASALNGSGQATCRTSSLSALASPHTITATYPGSSTLAASSGTVQQAVNKATLTVTANDAGKTYGDPNPSFSAGLSGFVNGEDSSAVSGAASCTTDATAASGAGTYPITCSRGTLSAANYAFAFANGALTVDRRALTGTAPSLSRTYGDSNPSLDATLSGFVNGDTAASAVTGAASCSTAATAASGVGAYPITCAAGTLAAANYSFGPFVPGTLTVTKAPLTVRADDASKVYGDPNPAFSGSVSGVKNGDDLLDSYTTSADSRSDVGSYAIAAHVDAGLGADLANYDVTLVDGTLTVTKAPLTVRADDASKVYGDPNPAFSGSVIGIRNGDDISATFSSAADGASGVEGSPYPIVPQAVAGPGASLANYDITPVNGALTVTPAPLTVAADDASRTYGDPNPVLTGTVTGARNGDDLVDSYTTPATEVSGVGSYPIDAHVAAGAGADLANYDVHLAAGTLAVTRAPLTVTADDKTKVYGDANPALTGTVTGGKNGDVLVDSYSTAADATSTVAGGPYAIVPQVAAGPGASLDNYAVTLVSGSLTVTQAPLTITADDKSKVLNAPNPVLTGTITGLRNGDAITAGYSTAATAGSPVGTYTITPAAIDSSPSRLGNYRVTLASGTLTVTYATGTCAGSAGRTVLQPVNADGSSVFKRGSTVPVKFRVCDANGVSIGTAGVVTGNPAAPVLVSKSSGAGGVDESVYSTTPDSSFRWDPSAQQWIYNQATSNLTSGVAYTYRIPLNDGTWITYRFGIK